MPSLRPRLTIETGASVSGRMVTVSSDTGAQLSWSDGDASNWTQLSPTLLQFRDGMQAYPGLAPVHMDSRSGDELRVHTTRSLMSVIVSPEADSVSASGRLKGFARDGALEAGGRRWTRWIRILPAGSHSLDISAHEFLYLESSRDGAQSVDTESVATPTNDSVNAYPNPFQESLRLGFDEDGERRIELIDMVGRRLLRADVNGIDVRIDTRAVPAGTYVLRITGFNRSSSSRVVTRL